MTVDCTSPKERVCVLQSSEHAGHEYFSTFSRNESLKSYYDDGFAVPGAMFHTNLVHYTVGRTQKGEGMPGCSPRPLNCNL